jgi:cytochrome c biogenesis protein CcmG, thiol:disulfide interchange protein DsbE
MARVSPLMLLPPVLFVGLAATFLWGMARQDPGTLPSALIGQTAPALPAAGLPGLPVATDADLRTGKPVLVNFWASWCPPCRAEHPKLKELAAQGVRIVGVNFRDAEANASRYIAEEGNPFAGVQFDPKGRTAIDWGVTAPPETFILDGDGRILFRFAGPLVGSDYEQRFLPEWEKALRE